MRRAARFLAVSVSFHTSPTGEAWSGRRWKPSLGWNMEVAAIQATQNVCAILIVDDTIATRAPLGALLRTCGYRVFEAADADEALALLNSRLEIEVLVTDVQMPGSMDGLALARWVRKTRPRLRVVVLSGLDLGAQLAGEGVACFSKPLPSAALLAALPPPTFEMA
jgi:CheY-like chemotaxis protein